MRFLVLTTAGLLGLAPTVTAVEPPKLRELRTQTVNGTTYFQARFDRPANLWTDNWTERSPPHLARIPRLVPQDDITNEIVCLTFNLAGSSFAYPSEPQDNSDLMFFGRTTGKGKARLVLLYATGGNAQTHELPTPVETAVELDFSKAISVPAFWASENRDPNRRPLADDLQGWWAVGQTLRFNALHLMAPSFSFFDFAQAAIGRVYRVRTGQIATNDSARSNADYQHLYELTTGAAALTESLQMDRMLNRRRKEGPRTIDIGKVQGIDIAGHDWKKMMGDKTPEPEPLAKLVPHDNYYLHFKTFSKFVEMTDFLDQWGTTAVRAYEVQSTDYRLKERYEKQLCIKTSLLGRTLGPLVIKGLAITGSDPYFREGTDVAVIFHVVNADLFRAGVEPYLREARAEFGDRLREGKETYLGVTIETFLTPQREVSLYRTSIDDYVVYANSPAGIRRILAARAGTIKPLADSLDFQYMRTIFKQSDENEDGFLFLADPFIRRLVGPSVKIREKRRLEGLASLTMATNAALWEAWQTGKPAASLDTALAAAALTTLDLATVDQLTVTWDAARQLAIGNQFNTLHFATPLVELPIDLISRDEEQDYNQFRLQYLGLWRQYFDPVGMRFRIRNGDVGVETFILPLIQSTEYNTLRGQTGGGTIPSDVSLPTSRTVAQLLTHIAPENPWRNNLTMNLNALGAAQGAQWLGDWAVIRFDDSPLYAKLAGLSDSGQPSLGNASDWIETVFQIPMTIGVEVRNPLVFAGVLTALRTAVFNAAPGLVTWEPMEPDYKGLKIVRIRATEQGIGAARNFVGGQEKKNPFLPAIYYALVDGAWYASLQDQPIKDMIDRAEARTKQPADAKATEGRPINSALYVSPAAAVTTKNYIQGFMEKMVHERALANSPVWYAFQKSGLLRGKESEASRQAVLFQYLGYVPVSPDGAAYIYDPKTDEMSNTRHGSPRLPTAKTVLDQDSPLGQLLAKTRDINADLRFREDGVHTTVTIRRNK